MHLIQIPPEAVPRIWPMAAPMLARAVEFTGGYTTLDKEFEHICAKLKQLWFVIDDEGGNQKPVAAGVTSIQKNEDGSLTANVELFGGENMKAWFSLKDQFEQWAKIEGCKDIRLWARKGWAKHLSDFKLTHYIMRKELT